jgi:hypothetical protein
MYSLRHVPGFQELGGSSNTLSRPLRSGRKRGDPTHPNVDQQVAAKRIRGFTLPPPQTPLLSLGPGTLPQLTNTEKSFGVGEEPFDVPHPVVVPELPTGPAPTPSSTSSNSTSTPSAAPATPKTYGQVINTVWYGPSGKEVYTLGQDDPSKPVQKDDLVMAIKDTGLYPGKELSIANAYISQGNKLDVYSIYKNFPNLAQRYDPPAPAGQVKPTNVTGNPIPQPLAGSTNNRNSGTPSNPSSTLPGTQTQNPQTNTGQTIATTGLKFLTAGTAAYNAYKAIVANYSYLGNYAADLIARARTGLQMSAQEEIDFNSIDLSELDDLSNYENPRFGGLSWDNMQQVFPNVQDLENGGFGEEKEEFNPLHEEVEAINQDPPLEVNPAVHAEGPNGVAGEIAPAAEEVAAPAVGGVEEAVAVVADIAPEVEGAVDIGVAVAEGLGALEVVGEFGAAGALVGAGGGPVGAAVGLAGGLFVGLATLGIAAVESWI